MINKAKIAAIGAMALLASANAADAATYTGRKLLDALNDSVPAVRTFAGFLVAKALADSFPCRRE